MPVDLYIPGSNIISDFSLYPEGSSMEKSVMIKNSWVEPNYMDILNIHLVAGRKFTDNREAEDQKIILNETAVRNLGFEPAEIIGQPLYNDYSDGRTIYEVVGVMEDYHQITVKEEIYPVLFRVPLDETFHHYMVLDIAGLDVENTLGSIEKVWKNLNPETPFDCLMKKRKANTPRD